MAILKEERFSVILFVDFMILVLYIWNDINLQGWRLPEIRPIEPELARTSGGNVVFTLFSSISHILFLFQSFSL